MKPLEELLAWSKRQQGRVTAAVRQAKRDKQVLPLLRALERAIFSNMVPPAMRWGVTPGKYPGHHSVRKLLLKYEAEIGDMHWRKQAILGAGPDARGHLVSLKDWPAHKVVPGPAKPVVDVDLPGGPQVSVRVLLQGSGASQPTAEPRAEVTPCAGAGDSLFMALSFVKVVCIDGKEWPKLEDGQKKAHCPEPTMCGG